MCDFASSYAVNKPTIQYKMVTRPTPNMHSANPAKALIVIFENIVIFLTYYTDVIQTARMDKFR